MSVAPQNGPPPSAEETTAEPGRAFARSSLQLLGASMQRIQAEAKARNLDGRRLRTWHETLGNTAKTVKDSVNEFSESETGVRIRSTVGGATATLAEKVQEIRHVSSDIDDQTDDDVNKGQNSDGQRLRALHETLGNTARTVKESVNEMAVSPTGVKIRSTVRSTVGDATALVAGKVQEVRQRVNSHDADLEALQRRMRDSQQELEAEHMTKEAEAACLNVIRRHLHKFIEDNPEGTYDMWLRELHPDNDYEGKLLEGFSELDHRFYVQESDHLKMWNESVAGGRQKVEPRGRLGGHEDDAGKDIVDLLDMSGSGPSSMDMAPPAASAHGAGGGDDLSELSGQPNKQEKETKKAEEEPDDIFDLFCGERGPEYDGEAGGNEDSGKMNEIDLI